MDQLQRKTDQYETHLEAGCEEAQSIETAYEEGQACLEMAQAYLADGKHFREAGDDVTALAAFSYGHGWLDAGIRIGVLDGTEEGDLFAN